MYNNFIIIHIIQKIYTKIIQKKCFVFSFNSEILLSTAPSTFLTVKVIFQVADILKSLSKDKVLQAALLFLLSSIGYPTACFLNILLKTLLFI